MLEIDKEVTMKLEFPSIKNINLPKLDRQEDEINLLDTAPIARFIKDTFRMDLSYDDPFLKMIAVEDCILRKRGEEFKKLYLHLLFAVIAINDLVIALVLFIYFGRS